MQTTYLFQSERLGFRNWQDNDWPKMSKINANPAVMEFFPSTNDAEKTKAFITTMQKQLLETGFCYFAVDRLSDGEFIGFIGLSRQTYEASFTPCIDIGWRLAEKAWSKGYATEGAKRCLDYAFQQLNLERILSVAPAINVKSQRVMQKIGMTHIDTFDHPLLLDNERLKSCVLYEVKKENYLT